jgi:hypothetical protein
MNRTPPVNIRRQLRQEVNFGCPINGCGIPYLTYHHFDPPWREKEHHNPEGIIALCPTHAAIADGGAWTKNQIKEFKQQPFIRTDQIADSFRFLRHDIVCQIGCLAYGFKNFITISNETVLGFERTPQGYLGLNMILRNREGKIILEMKENDWIVYTTEIFDFECPARGKSFRVRAKDDITDFTVRFDDLSTEEFREGTREYKPDQIECFLKQIGEPEEIHLLKISGRLQMGKHDIRLTETEINVESKNVHFNLKAFSFIGHGSLSLFSFNEDGTITMG